jgi:LysR family transcriptional regulator, regulator for bpeEF and oprC
MDTLEAMRVFVRIVDAGNFARASESYGFTRSKVSNLMQTLERHLGSRLLHRTTRRVSVTEDGLVYYERCVAILSEIDDMEASLSQAKNAPKGRIKVSLPPAMAKAIIIPELPKFFELNPAINVELKLTEQLVDVIGEGVDCAVRVGPLDDSGLIAKRIGSITTCICASRSYLERHGTPQTIEQVKRHMAINYVSSETGRSRLWDFNVGGEVRSVEVMGMISVNDVDAYVSCALAGLGLAKTSRYLVAPYLQAGMLEEVLATFNSPPRPISVVYAPNRHPPKKLKIFIDWLAALCAKNPVLQGSRH